MLSLFVNEDFTIIIFQKQKLWNHTLNFTTAVAMCLGQAGLQEGRRRGFFSKSRARVIDDPLTPGPTAKRSQKASSEGNLSGGVRV